MAATPTLSRAFTQSATGHQADRTPPPDAHKQLWGMYEVGLYTFDGAGGFMARAVFNFSGGVLFGAGWDLNLPGTYTVNADGTGTMTLAGLHRSHFVMLVAETSLSILVPTPIPAS